MSMMERMRSGTDSSAMQIVLFLIVGAMLFWFAVPQGTDTATTVATVDGQPILDTELQQAMRERRRYMGDPRTDEEQAERIAQVKQDLVRNAVLEQQARAMGLVVSDVEVAALVKQDRRFQDTDGAYSAKMWRQFVDAAGRSEDAVIDDFRRQALRQKLRWLVTLTSDVAESDVREAWLANQSTVDVQFVALDPDVIGENMPIDANALSAWAAEHGEAIQARYDRDFPRKYDLPEQVRLRELALSIRPDGPEVAELTEMVAARRAEIEAGADFAEVARRWSEGLAVAEGGDRGLEKLPNLKTVVREAVAELPEGGLSEIVTTELQVAIYQVVERVAAREVPLDEVRADIAATLYREERQEQVARELAERVRSEWSAAGMPPMIELLPFGIELSSTGPTPFDAPGSVSGPPPEMMAAARASEAGTVLDRVYELDGGLGGTTLFVGKVSAVKKAKPADFEQVKGPLLETSLLLKRNSFWQRWVDAKVADATVVMN